MSGEQQQPFSLRKRSSLHLPITLSVALISLNVALMIFWIVLLAKQSWWGALTIGTVAFTLILVGLSFYMVIVIKEVRLNRRQANFVDSVTHELKSPIASLKLYLETLQMRSIDEEQKGEFLGVMETELNRLDHLISQLLEVGRLDAIGMDTEPEDILLGDLLQHCGEVAARKHKIPVQQSFSFELQPVIVHSRPILLEMIFSNLFDNAIKYGGAKPQVHAKTEMKGRGRISVQIIDNGEGVDPDIRKKIFQIFYRGGNELERRRTGTGLGLYIARTLVQSLKGKLSVRNRENQSGSIFEVELPGRLKDEDTGC